MNISARASSIFLSLMIGFLITMVSSLALAEPATYSGVPFPLGDRSFADRVVSYRAASCVKASFANPRAALGPPDCDGDGCRACYGCDTCAVALGYRLSELDDRGYLTLEFVDNLLLDVPGDDLFVYITNGKRCQVEISANGINFIFVGEVSGYPEGIDISPFVSDKEEFRFVRLRDVPRDEDPSSCSGPSIDAVGAMGTALEVEPGEAFGGLEVLPLGELAISAEKPAENLLLILDTSTSMDEPFEDSSKLDVAKRILLELVDDILDGTEVGFRSFGGCGNSELLVPIGPIDRTELKAQIQVLQTGGATPLAYALEKAREDCAQIAGSKLLILVSDVQETCRGDPIAAARDLAAAGYDLRVHVVGYDVAQFQAAREQLKKIAEVTGGVYFDVDDTEGLRSALRIAAPLHYWVYDESGQEVFAGVVGEPEAYLSAGLYRVVIDTLPPLTLESVAVEPDQTTTIAINRLDGTYSAEVK